MQTALAQRALTLIDLKRKPIVSGKTTAITTIYADQYCYGPTPVSTATIKRLGLNTPTDTLSAFVEGATDTTLAIQDGDFLTVKTCGIAEYVGQTFLIQNAQKRARRGKVVYELLLERAAQ